MYRGLSTVSRDLGLLRDLLDTAHKARYVGALNLMVVGCCLGAQKIGWAATYWGQAMLKTKN
jgi:hypothetical protein